MIQPLQGISPLRWSPLIGNRFNMIHNALVVKVDCVVRKDSEYRREEFARRRPVNIAGQQVYIVALEDLILSKLDWAKESRSQL